MSLDRYIARRALIAIPTLLGVSVIVFVFMSLIPGDPVKFLIQFQQGATADLVTSLRHQYHLDSPIYIRYVLWMRDVLRGDFGRSLITGKDVTAQILATLPRTLILGGLALTFAWGVALIAGSLAATRKGTIVDPISRVVALFGISMPSFWIGLLLLALFTVRWRWVSPIPPVEINFLRLETQEFLLLPMIALGAPSAALITRLIRSSLLDVLQEEFIVTAQAKGLGRRMVLLKHAFKNALIPVVTVMGLQLAIVVGGAVIVEEIFSWPGIGRLLVQAINQRDLPVVQAVALVVATSVVLVNLLVDVFYAVLDPRIRYTS